MTRKRQSAEITVVKDMNKPQLGGRRTHITALDALASIAALAEPRMEGTRILLGELDIMTGVVATVCAPATYCAEAWFHAGTRPC